jgi:hypothetical protein
VACKELTNCKLSRESKRARGSRGMAGRTGTETAGTRPVWRACSRTITTYSSTDCLPCQYISISLFFPNREGGPRLFEWYVGVLASCGNGRVTEQPQLFGAVIPYSDENGKTITRCERNEGKSPLLPTPQGWGTPGRFNAPPAKTQV